jgi:ParB family chromosome partitioning protein
VSGAGGAGVFRQVPLHLVDDPVTPSRSDMDDEKMEALVESIRAIGVTQNVTLIDHGERFEVNAGHRRTIAARRAGLVFLPAMVYPPDHPALRVIQAHENGRREDVNPVDEAFWFRELLERDCGGDVERLCGLVGEKLHYVDGRLALLDLDERTREALRLGQIKIGVARELQRCTDESYRRYYLEHAVKSGATTSVVSGWITEWKNIQDASGPARPAPTQPAAEGARPDLYDPLRCYICGRSDRRIPEQVAIHTSCREAILDELLTGAGTHAGPTSEGAVHAPRQTVT